MKFRSKDGRIHNNRVSMLLANIKSKVSSRKSDEDEFLDFEEFDDDLFDEDDDDSDRSISEIDKNVLISSADQLSEMSRAADESLRSNAKTAYDAEAVDKAINDQLNAAANAGIINPPDGSSATVTLEDGRKIELRNIQAVDDSTDILDEPIEDDLPIHVTEHPVEGSVDVSIFRGYANEDDPEIMYKLKRDAELERSMSEEETNDSDEGEQL